jgi:hypothetical protein
MIYFRSKRKTALKNVLLGRRIYPGGAYDKRRTEQETAAEAAAIQEKKTQKEEFRNADADRLWPDRAGGGRSGRKGTL